MGFIAENSKFAIEERFLLHIQTNPDSWVRVETSQDMENWEELVNMRVWKEATVYFDETSSRAGQRFYRLSDHVTSIAEARSCWLEREITRYRYRLQWAEGLVGASVMVTVDDDVKIVTGIDVDQDWISAHMGEDFPDIEELFALLIAAEDSGARGIHVSYDSELGYPTRIWIDHNPYRNVLEGFVITDFEILSG